MQATGRAEVSQFTRKPAEPLAGDFRQGQMQILPLNKTGRRQRGILWADVDGDGRRRFDRGGAGERPAFGLPAAGGRHAGVAEEVSLAWPAFRRLPCRIGTGTAIRKSFC